MTDARQIVNSPREILSSVTAAVSAASFNVEGTKVMYTIVTKLVQHLHTEECQ